MRNKYYYFTRSTALKLTTWTVVAVLLIGLLVMLLSGAPVVVCILFAALEVVVVAGCVLCAPRCMYIDRGSIVINKYCNNTIIPLSEVTEIEKIEGKIYNNSVRTFGNSGVFAYVGRYYSKRIGKYTLYATDLSMLVRIRTLGRQYVVSCNEADEFIAQVNALKVKI